MYINQTTMTLINISVNNIAFNFQLDSENNLVKYHSYNPDTGEIIKYGYYSVDVILLETIITNYYSYYTERHDIVDIFCSLLEFHGFKPEVIDFLRPSIMETNEVMNTPIPTSFWEPVSLRLSEEDFLKLNTKPMSKKLKKELDLEEVDDCVICMEEIRSRMHCTTLECKHIFHKKCIKQWLMKDCQLPTCPCCRMDVRKSLSK